MLAHDVLDSDIITHHAHLLPWHSSQISCGFPHWAFSHCCVSVPDVSSFSDDFSSFSS